MTDAPVIADNRLLLPPECFFWAVLDTSAISRQIGGMQQRLGYLFENVLPVPIEQVQAVYCGVNGNYRMIACGMSRERLSEHVGKHPIPGSLAHLGPDTLPEFVQVELGKIAVAAGQFNLLSGEFEPPEVRLARRQLYSSLFIILLTCGVLAVIGLERRTAALRKQAVHLEIARSTLYTDVLTSSTGAASTQPPELRLITELRRLRQTRQKPLNDSPEADSQRVDCGPILADLLAHWPADVLMQTESISITATSIVLRGSAPGSQDVQRLADALGQVNGWQLQQPQINAARDNVQASLQLTRVASRETTGITP